MTPSDINKTADGLYGLLGPHLLNAIASHKSETLAKVPWPARGFVEKHWPCIEEFASNVCRTALRVLLAKLGDQK